MKQWKLMNLFNFTESNLTEQYRSNDMMSGKTSSMSIRDDLQNSNANIWVCLTKITSFFFKLKN